MGERTVEEIALMVLKVQVYTAALTVSFMLSSIYAVDGTAVPALICVGLGAWMWRAARNAARAVAAALARAEEDEDDA